MAAYTVLNVDLDGVRFDNALVAVAASDTFANDGNTFLAVNNGDASPTNVTFDLATDPHSSEPTQSTTATNIVVTNAEDEFIGPFPIGKFGTTVTVNYSNQTSITAGAFRLVG